MYSEVGTCCICGKEYTHFGNNPYPLTDDEEARCCKSCDFQYVIPARIIAGRPFDLETAKMIEYGKGLEVEAERALIRAEEYAEHKLEKDGYKLHKVNGAYKVTDEEGNPVDFDMAELFNVG